MFKNKINLTELNSEVEKLIVSLKAENRVSLISTKEKTINGVFEILVTLLIIQHDVAFPFTGNETIPDIIEHLRTKLIELGAANT